MTDLDYIKKFSKITIKQICKENHIDYSNLWAGRSASSKVHLVRKAIESKMGKLQIDEFEELKNDYN